MESKQGSMLSPKLGGIKLSSLEKHTSIGFDVDHCLVRYKIKALTLLSYDALMETLVEEKEYPRDLLKISEEELGIGLNYCLIDVEKGTILKMLIGKKIARGYRGYRAIDVVKEYGETCTLEEFDPISVRKDPRFIVCSTYFENIIAVLFAKILEYRFLKAGTEDLTHTDYSEVIEDIIFSLRKNYAHYNDKQVFPIADHGKFFKAILSDPARVLVK